MRGSFVKDIRNPDWKFLATIKLGQVASIREIELATFTRITDASNQRQQPQWNGRNWHFAAV
jgi:hypothetical protein